MPGSLACSKMFPLLDNFIKKHLDSVQKRDVPSLLQH